MYMIKIFLVWFKYGERNTDMENTTYKQENSFKELQNVRMLHMRRL